MPPASIPDRTPSLSAWIITAVCLLGLAAIGVASLDLSAYGLAHYLNSDFLTPYFFCTDLLSGHYPISGWTLSASPYFVPDHLVLGGLMVAFGRTGLAYALFTLIFYPAMFILAGFCVKSVVGRTGPAFVASLAFGNVLLALRVLPGHARCLWWIGAPTCHGGVLLLGFAYLWTLGVGLRRGNVGRLPVALFCLGFVGLLSDSLFLFQVLLPASVALFFGRRRHAGFVRWLRWQGVCGAAALLCAQLFKPLCRMAGWFYFSRIIRVAPTPVNQWHTLGQFVSDLPPLLQDNWGFALLLLAATITLFRSLRATPQTVPVDSPEHGVHGGVLDFYRVFCVASLFIMLPLPILSCGWKDVNNVRYLFNWLVLPGFLLTIEIAARWNETRRSGLIGATTIFLVCLGCAIGGLRHETLAFPYPDEVAALDTVLQRRGLKYGLAQYWNAKDVTALSHAGVELRQIRADGGPYFWDNNAFGYYERDANGKFSWPTYQYVLTDRLDEQAVTRAFGEPEAKEIAGRYRVWIYGQEGQRRIREVLEPAVREKLGTKRLAAAGMD